MYTCFKTILYKIHIQIKYIVKIKCNTIYLSMFKLIFPIHIILLKFIFEIFLKLLVSKK